MTKKWFKNLLALLVLGLLTSCVSENKGSNPNCAAGTSFDKLSQKCVSFGIAPTSTLNVLNLSEDDPLTKFTLQYTDDNNDQATRCQVFDTESDFEVRSPIFNTISSDVSEIVNTITQCVTSIDSITYPSERTAATVLLTQVQEARDGIYSTDKTDGMSAAINLLSARVLDLTNYCEGFSSSPVTQFYGESAKKLNNALVSKKEWIDNRCYCAAGECSAEIILNKDISGSYGVAYNISDEVDGTSLTKQVLVEVATVNDKPIASDLYITGNESITTLSSPISFTIPVGRDVENDYSPFLTYHIVAAPTKGIISGCALSSDGSSSTDRSCTYTPNDKDAGVDFLATKKSSLTIPTNGSNNLIFTSKTVGAYGDDISISIVSQPLLNTANNVNVEVNGRDIIIYIDNEVTNIDSVESAVESHMEASALVDVTQTNSDDDSVEIFSKTNLSGGVSPFDTFSYKVNDGESLSEYAGRGSIDIFLQDDPPVASTISSSSLLFVEDTAQSVRLPFTDSENHLATACSVIPDSTDLVVSSACTCSATDFYCDVEFTPAKDFTGVALFEWSISTTGDLGVVQTTEDKNEVITVEGVNDAPFAKSIDIDLGVESNTATPSAYTFNLSDATSSLGIDVDGDVLTYQLLSNLGGATLTGCVSGTTLLQGSDCIYTPTNGNVNSVATKASVTYTEGGSSIQFQAKNAGELMNGVDIIIQDSPLAVHLGVIISVDSTSTSNINVNILINSGMTTLGNIYTAILADTYASELISPLLFGGGGDFASIGTHTLSGASDAAAKLEYKVTDSSGSSAYGAVHLNITNTDDYPVICPYSDFTEAPECGLAGCIGDSSPVTNVTPKTTGLLYYDRSSAVCYKSSGTASSSDWAIVTDFTNILEKKIVNQNGYLEINKIMIDEGGADTTEDAQGISITDISVADGGQGLIPRKGANIQVFFDNTKVDLLPLLPTGASDPLFGDVEDAHDPLDLSTPLSSDRSAVKVRIIPSDGVTGTAVVTITFSDGTNEVDLAIPVEITDVAVQHKGWTNIVAMGPKVDKNGNVKDADYVCNYSETKCDDGESCSGVSVPNGNIVADEINTIYYEQASTSKPNGQCYYASNVGSSNWIAFDSFCNITPSYYDSACSNASCLDTSSTDIPAIAPSELNTFFTNLEYDSLNDITNTTCYRSIGRKLPGGTDLSDTEREKSWQEYKGTGSVELKWNSMLLTGSGTISGYNVFRRLSNEDFDYNRKINKNLIPAYTNEYIDNSSNSNFGPIPNTVYFYEVVPVVSTGTPAENVQIRSSDFEKIVLRVLVPGQNRVLVPRDIVNITQCDKLLDSSSSGSNYEYDSSLNTFTCPYEGPGDSGTTTGSTVYDFGRDLIVDRFEAGCPYTKSNEAIEACPTGLSNVATSGSCIGTVDPDVADGGGAISFSTSSNQVYYNRSSGQCFQHNGTTWTEFDSLNSTRLASLADRYQNAELPPVVYSSQSTSNNFCAETETESILGICNTSIAGFSVSDGKCVDSTTGLSFENYNNLSGRLPSRKEQVAYSDWDYTDISDSTANTREGGLSLNSNSKCNTSSANGLESFYTDSVTPISNTLYTLPGTLSSGIRSLMTGSSETELCSSKYGVQDTIGNVNEWSNDRFLCDNFSCEAVVYGDGNYIGHAQEIDTDEDSIPDTVIDDDFKPADGTTTNFVKYELNGVTGPCIDTTGAYLGTSCNGYLTSWIFDQKSNLSSRFFTPMGLPGVTKYITDNAGEFINFFFEQIGISSGITSTKLHDDTIVVNQERLDATSSVGNPSGVAGVTTGGSYLSSNGAGTYHLEMIAKDDASYSKRVDVGFRCVFPVSSGDYVE